MSLERRAEGFLTDNYRRTGRVRPADGIGLNPIVVVTGVTGSGKEFLLDKTFESLPADARSRVLNVGTFMTERIPVPRDEMGQQGSSAVLPVLRALEREAIARAPLVLDAHLVPKRRGVPTAYPRLTQTLRPAEIVLITGDPEAIVDWRIRRNKEGKRNSDIEDIQSIHKHQLVLNGVVRVLGGEMGSGITIIYNTPQQTYDSVKRMREVIAGVIETGAV